MLIVIVFYEEMAGKSSIVAYDFDCHITWTTFAKLACQVHHGTSLRTTLIILPSIQNHGQGYKNILLDQYFIRYEMKF